ncbi:ACT domain-containing protein ACR3-like isoform X3 [Olea europaea var. sylvestris]|uniref:ACT domain-containing protein ACR3-like isoform X2 n=1 Tax=Olea europaea var. sylvestris TaxID=158386 RepID=UPI000C1CDDBB|nr:ACT domain-containing protein ACR3-like isoform X2 [Olea europaea var. sylvestris]XP_022850301.1 ACT domain-containing protein ACR3-like isoform X3 [Olea europaea var. sylvestris]XP_022850302.1 ACT domain-containing protein ACR3-like isoform X3 [Olea europaea var. sylvestris]
MARDSWPYFDPEYETLSIRINPPQVSVDNSSCKNCTLVKVDSMNKPGILLEVVQILSDLDLIITKAYISSDGGWFMDVFHVTDQHGHKISDRRTIDYIEKALGPKSYTSDMLKSLPGKRVGVNNIGDYTAIELIGRDRPGLLSEIFAVLSDLHINVVAAEVWTHNRRIACILYVNDDSTIHNMNDASRLSSLEEQLKNILCGCGDDETVAHTSFSVGSTHVDRRLHQLLFADRDYEGNCLETEPDYSPSFKPNITIDRCEEKRYLVVNVRSKDRPKLMFDIVCTLTDMQYVVFHATISSDGPYALQEYYIRRMDGCTVDVEGEREKAVKCLEAAIRRRVSEGLSLELCAKDRVGLLSDVTRVLRENGLSVMRAGITTVGDQAIHVFYVSDAAGNPVDMKNIEGLRQEIGHKMMLNVKKVPTNTKSLESSGWDKTSFFFGSLLEKFRS